VYAGKCKGQRLTIGRHIHNNSAAGQQDGFQQACWLCGCQQPVVYHCWPEFRVLGCPQCGLRFTDLSNWRYPYSGADYYDATSMDRLVPHRPHIVRRVRDVQKHLARGRILDIGCGIGEFAIVMQEAGFDVEAIDESQLAIGALRGLRPEVKWHCGNVLEHLDELGRFDLVTMYHVLEHIPNPLAAMEGIKRLLAPGGLLVLEVPNARGLQARFKGPRWQYFERHHVNYFGPRHLRSLAAKLGLQVVAASGFYHLSHPQGVWWRDTIKAALAGLGFKDVISIVMRAPESG
jgi:2-polyprenyl-3-methyl-5-hydroxy-6-metoxy-1,4-benzoquinol methylase